MSREKAMVYNPSSFIVEHANLLEIICYDVNISSIFAVLLRQIKRYKETI